MIIYSKMTGVILTGAEANDVWTDQTGDVYVGNSIAGGYTSQDITDYPLDDDGNVTGEAKGRRAALLEAIFQALLSGAPAVVISADGEVEGQEVTTEEGASCGC